MSLKIDRVANEVAEIRNLLKPITAALWVPPPSMVNDVAIMYFESRMMAAVDVAFVQQLISSKYRDQIMVAESTANFGTLLIFAADRITCSLIVLRRKWRRRSIQIVTRRNGNRRIFAAKTSKSPIRNP
jgi:hypothetical protein